MGKPVVFTAEGERQIHNAGFPLIATGYKDGVNDDDLATVGQVRNSGGSAPGFVASCYYTAIQEDTYIPVGFLPQTVEEEADLREVGLILILTVNRGSYWGDITIDTVVTGSIDIKTGPTTIVATECQQGILLEIDLTQPITSTATITLTGGDTTWTSELVIEVGVGTPQIDFLAIEDVSGFTALRFDTINIYDYTPGQLELERSNDEITWTSLTSFSMPGSEPYYGSFAIELPAPYPPSAGFYRIVGRDENGDPVVSSVLTV